MEIFINIVAVASGLCGIALCFFPNKRTIIGVIAIVIAIAIAMIGNMPSIMGSDIPTSSPSPTITPTPKSIPTQPTFVQHTSETYNYKIDCPEHFVEEGMQEEDDFNLTSPDRKANLVLTARFIENGELPEKFQMNYFRTLYPGTEIYSENQIDQDGWYVISIKSTDGFYRYRKCIFSGGIARMYTFSFPIEQEEIYLQDCNYVYNIEKSFTKLY